MVPGRAPRGHRAVREGDVRDGGCGPRRDPARRADRSAAPRPHEREARTKSSTRSATPSQPTETRTIPPSFGRGCTSVKTSPRLTPISHSARWSVNAPSRRTRPRSPRPPRATRPSLRAPGSSGCPSASSSKSASPTPAPGRPRPPSRPRCRTRTSPSRRWACCGRASSGRGARPRGSPAWPAPCRPSALACRCRPRPLVCRCPGGPDGVSG